MSAEKTRRIVDGKPREFGDNAPVVEEEKLRPDIMFRAMLHKVNALMKTEVKMNKAERGSQQWQLLFQIAGYGDYIIGKGGVNTMFYTINSGERTLCYPHELTAKIQDWINQCGAKTYAVVTPKGKILQSGIVSKEEALATRYKVGNFIVSVHQGKTKKLFVRSEGLVKNTWKPVESALKKRG